MFRNECTLNGDYMHCRRICIVAGRSDKRCNFSSFEVNGRSALNIRDIPPAKKVTCSTEYSGSVSIRDNPSFQKIEGLLG